jgi:hypothetical protein
MKCRSRHVAVTRSGTASEVLPQTRSAARDQGYERWPRPPPMLAGLRQGLAAYRVGAGCVRRVTCRSQSTNARASSEHATGDNGRARPGALQLLTGSANVQCRRFVAATCDKGDSLAKKTTSSTQRHSGATRKSAVPTGSSGAASTRNRSASEKSPVQGSAKKHVGDVLGISRARVSKSMKSGGGRPQGIEVPTTRGQKGMKRARVVGGVRGRGV